MLRKSLPKVLFQWTKIGFPSVTQEMITARLGGGWGGGTAYSASASTFADHQDTGVAGGYQGLSSCYAGWNRELRGQWAILFQNSRWGAFQEDSEVALWSPRGHQYVGIHTWTCNRASLYIHKKGKKELSLSVGYSSLSAAGPQEHRHRGEALVGSGDGDRQRKHKVTVRRGVSSGFSLHR